MAPPGGGGGKVGDRDENCSIRDHPNPGHLLQAPWESPLCRGRQLFRSGTQLLEGMAKVGAAVYVFDQKGLGCPDLGETLGGSGSGSNTVRVKDVNYDKAHWEGLGRIPPLGGLQDDRNIT